MVARQEDKIHDDSTQPRQEDKKHDQMKWPGDTFNEKNWLPIRAARDDYPNYESEEDLANFAEALL